MRKLITTLGFCIFSIVIYSAAAAAQTESNYYVTTVGKLKLAGELPAADGMRRYFDAVEFNFKIPSARLAGPGEVYIQNPLNSWEDENNPLEARRIAFCVPAKGELKGTLCVPAADGAGMIQIPFTYQGVDGVDGAAGGFNEVKESHYHRLREARIPGGAWFRYQEAEALRARGKDPATDTTNREGNMPFRDFGGAMTTTFDIFTGGRAISENLQLERSLGARDGGEEKIDITTIGGITISPFDWTALTKDLKPDLDHLSKAIPADQHAVFFPSFQKMLDVLDSADRTGTPILRWSTARAEDAGTAHRYKKQLLLETSEVARLLGPSVISSVAVTGSDPYVQMGTDVAVLFDTKNPAILKTFLGGRYKSAESANVKVETGEIDGVQYTGARDADRTICSYMASLGGDVVVVTNSLAQLKRLAAVSKGGASLAGEKEYIYFRDRYKKGDPRESAFILLTDATIRRWCEARWRIGDSRRTRALASMLDAQSRNALSIGGDSVTSAAVDLKDLPTGGLELTNNGVRSAEFGALEFMTPIIELDIRKITPGERSAYEFMRDHYQSNWRAFFDPIAARLSLNNERASLDLTIMPLIAGSEYNEWIDVTRNAKLAADAGDPHDDAFLHLAFGLNLESRSVRSVGKLVKPFGLDVDPMSWIGNHAALFFDKDPFWDEAVKAKDPKEFFGKRIAELPIGFFVDVKNGLKLTGFLMAIHGFADASAPGMLTWSPQSHQEQPYVKISVTEEGARDLRELDKVCVYYAATPGSFILTLNENLLKRSLERQAARKLAKKEGKEAPATRPWIGESIAARADASCMQAIQLLLRENIQKSLREASWSNLAILNEWKRRFPAADPVAVHEKIYKVKLVCPGGGSYIWDEKWQTMSSSVFGHPAEPKDTQVIPLALQDVTNAAFGITFENSGLRAAVEFDYK